LSFRRFRRKLHELSRIYWNHQIGAESILKLSLDAKPDDFIVDVLGCSFDRGMYPKTVSETGEWIPKYLEIIRLHILIITSAYLKDITLILLLLKV